jgi:DNA primase
MNDIINEIKSRLDIVEVISSYLKLQKVGVNFRTNCPFHPDKNPSFFVSPAKQIWHCFGCQRGGSLIDFVKEIEGVEFADALRILAKKAGIELKPLPKEVITKRKRIYDILELATKFYQKQLEGKVGREVKEYLLSRGMNEDSIKKWRLGWAPNLPTPLSEFLISQGFSLKELEEAGLIYKDEKNSVFDRFRGRIIFPIFDLNSQVIGFGGRIFERYSKEGIAKYINTPNTLVYDKGKVLYGLDKARVEIRRKDFVILVEGYIDCILSHQAGFENAVSCSGTALTKDQLKILQRYTKNLYLAFDMDVGGETATQRGIKLAQSLGFEIKIVNLPYQKDPADIICENPKNWEELIEKAQSILEYYFEFFFSKFEKEKLEGKKEIVKNLLPFIKVVQNEIEKAFWLEKLAEKLNLKVETLFAEMKKIDVGIEREEEEKIEVKKSRKEILEERILSLLLKKRDLLQNFNFDDFVYFSEKGKKIASFLKGNESEIGDAEKDYYNYLSFLAEVEEIEEKEIEKEIKFSLNELMKIKAKEEIERISNEIKEAERKNDVERIKKLCQEFSFWSEKIK